MTNVAELKQFVVAHAISQNLPPDHYRDVLDSIDFADGDSPGSWAHEWVRAGEELAASGDLHGATQYFVMGRFPFVDGPGKARALRKMIETFDQWRIESGSGIERRVVPFDGHEVPVWTLGLSAEQPRPLVIMTGGIVSPKEQWAAVLPQIAKFGLAGIVLDYPGVGESPLRLGDDSWRLFEALLDAVADEADVFQTFLLALSFSGHLALRAASHDARIRGVVGNGPPIRHFFADREWQTSVPEITRDTLAHLTGVPNEKVFERIAQWGLSDDELEQLTIPIAAVVASRDEIIPQADAQLLRKQVSDLTLLEHDDVHGAPKHLAHTRLWSLQAVLKMWADAPAELIAALEAGSGA